MPERGRIANIIRTLINRSVDMVVSHAEKRHRKSPPEPEFPAELEKIAKELDAQADKIWESPSELLKAREATAVPEAATPTPPSPEVTVETIPPSELEYCLECCDKHTGAGAKLMEEAIVFYDRAGEMSPEVTKKVRAVVDELAGMHDDVKPGSPEEVMAVLHRADDIRKEIWGRKLELGLGSREDLVAIKGMLSSLRDEIFSVAERYVGGGAIAWCKEWGAKDVRACYELFCRAKQEEGYEPISKEEFERRFSELTNKRVATEWDERGRLKKLRLMD